MENNINNTNENPNKGTGNKNIIIIVAVLLAAAVIVWGITALSGKKGEDNDSDNNNVQTQQKEDEIVMPNAKPVFKFFYSSSDENTADLLAAVEELKDQYGEQVDFDLNDIDEHPEYVEQFSIIMPPQLYMLKVNGDFADMKFGIYDKNELESSIKKALE